MLGKPIECSEPTCEIKAVAVSHLTPVETWEDRGVMTCQGFVWGPRAQADTTQTPLAGRHPPHNTHIHTDQLPSPLHLGRYTCIHAHVYTPICTANIYTCMHTHTHPCTDKPRCGCTFTLHCTPNTHTNMHYSAYTFTHTPVHVHLDTSMCAHSPHTHTLPTSALVKIQSQTYIDATAFTPNTCI